MISSLPVSLMSPKTIIGQFVDIDSLCKGETSERYLLSSQGHAKVDANE